MIESVIALNGGEQNDIIRKFVTKTDVHSAGKQNDIIRKVQKSIVISGGQQIDS